MGKQNWPYHKNKSENQTSYCMFFKLRVCVQSSLEMLPTVLNITLHYLNFSRYLHTKWKNCPKLGCEQWWECLCSQWAANVCTLHCCIRVFCIDDLYHAVSSASSETTPTSISVHKSRSLQHTGLKINTEIQERSLYLTTNSVAMETLVMGVSNN